MQWNFTRLEKKQNGCVIIWVEITEALPKDVTWRGEGTGTDKTGEQNG